MMMDMQNLYSDKQSLAVAAGNHLSENVIDHRKTGEFTVGGATVASRTPVYINDVGKGEPVPLMVQATQNFVGGTSVQVQLITSDTENMAAPTVLAETPAIPTAQLKAGYQFRLGHLPLGMVKRYSAVRYVTLGTFTAGAVTAGIVLDRQTSVPFA